MGGIWTNQQMQPPKNSFDNNGEAYSNSILDGTYVQFSTHIWGLAAKNVAENSQNQRDY